MSEKEYDNNLRGALFQNSERREGKKDPHYRGQCEIGGKEYWVSGWKKKSKNGDPYLSLSFSQKKEKENPKTELTDEEMDEIPF